ncbi:MAG: response regulator [Chitinophagaceae bacterium]|nr:response regulator [Chitinophagaceae bacterium]
MKKKIIVIDDEYDIGEILQIVLEEENFHVVCFTNALEAIRYAPDLFIIDHYLKGVSGSDICRQIKQNKLTNRTPIILMSVSNKLEALTAACKADAFIQKPFELEEVIRKVKELLEQ